jgi:hypothetical protein
MKRLLLPVLFFVSVAAHAQVSETRVAVPGDQDVPTPTSDLLELVEPVALASRYEHRSALDLLVPDCYRANEFLRVVQRLAGISRLKLTTKIGRKTFVTLKLYQGVPARLIMQPTGHQTEEAFNHYVGVDELRLVEEFMRKSTRRRAA